MATQGATIVLHRGRSEASVECPTPQRQMRGLTSPHRCPSSPPSSSHIANEDILTPSRARSHPPGSILGSREALNRLRGEEKETNVRVVCRLRPMSDREKKSGTVPATSASTEQKEVAVVRKAGPRQVRTAFHFDEVLSSFSTQRETFAATLQPLVEQVLKGYEATAFAYGQTGTGKTYTMEGEPDSEETRGLMPRAAAAVLEALSSKCYIEHSVTVSYLEIYNEELSDLLVAPQLQPKLELMESNAGITCVGLSEVAVHSLTDILNLVQMAQERKRIAETRVNARSSRSHCIFTMKVQCRKRVTGGELENCGKLHLVDLAGSECAKKAAWTGEEQTTPRHGGRAASPRPGSQMNNALEQERERRNINQSLLTLGRVIAALRCPGVGRIPYRDSKLTRLLKDALGGSCKTVLIATISPALSAVEETISTLSYAEQAAGIRNRPVASSFLRTVRAGTADLATSLNGVNLGLSSIEWSEVEMKIAYLAQEVEEAQAALARKYQENQELLERASAAESKVAKVTCELQEVKSQLEESNEIRTQMVSSARSLSTDLSSSIASSAAAREEIMRDIVQLKEQRSTEQKLIALLKQQREALQADVSGVQASLECAKAELTATHGEVADLNAAQERSRARTLQAIVSFVTNELNSLGTDLSQSSDSLCARLHGVEGHARGAGQSLAAAEGRSCQISNEVARVAAAWSQDVVNTIDTVEKKSGAASKAMEGVVSLAAERLKTIETLNQSLGSDVHEDGNDLNKENTCVTALSLSPSKVHDSFKVCPAERTAPGVAPKVRMYNNMCANSALKTRN